MKYIPYTEENKLTDWLKEAKRKKRKRKNFSPRTHKNLNSR